MYLAFFLDIYAPTNVCVEDINSKASTVLQNYQNFIETTKNMIHIVALGGGLKCPRKIHFNTQCFILSCLLNFFDPLENHGLNSWNLTVCYTDWRRNNLYVKMQTMEEKGKCLAVWGTWILYTTRTYGYKTPCMYLCIIVC